MTRDPFTLPKDTGHLGPGRVTEIHNGNTFIKYFIIIILERLKVLIL